MMQAAYIETFASSGNLKIGSLPSPEPKADEVCIRVAYAGVNPVDAKIAEGLLQSRMPHQFPLILGWEASGVIHSLGSQVTAFKVGDPVYVYCRKPVVKWGSWAEYVTFSAEHVALMPKNLSRAEAAAVPLAALTAWQALFDKAHLLRGETLLIHAGAGGVGGFAIQWAKIHGAKVITTASRSKVDYVKQLGADEVIDYQSTVFVDSIRKKHPSGIDVVLDTVGDGVYRRSFEVLKPGGRIVSILEQPDADLTARFGVRADYLFVSPNGKQLRECARLFACGKAKPHKVSVFPLEFASQAIDAIKTGHTAGKIVLKVRS
jgi:NADPH:quinone reductase-like Zn-dependent oxidoreductase